MATINIKDIAYNGSFLTTGGIKVGSFGVAGVFSKHKPASAKQKKSKNSAAVFFIEALLAKSIKVLSDGSRNCYIEYNGIRFLVTAANSTVRVPVIFYEGNEPSALDGFTVLTAYFATKQEDELKQCLDTIINDYISSGTVDTTNTAVFSENLYYRFFKDMQEISINEKNTLSNEVTQSIRNGVLREVEMLKEFACADTEISMDIKMGNLDVKDNSSKNFSGNGDFDENNPLCVLEKAKEGFYFVDYKWTIEEEKIIPSLSILDEYVPIKDFTAIVKKIKKHLTRITDRLKVSGSENGNNSGIETEENDDMQLTLNFEANNIKNDTTAKNTGYSEIIKHDYLNIFLFGEPGTGKTMTIQVLAAMFHLPVGIAKNSKNTEEDEYEGKIKPIEGKFADIDTDFVTRYEHGGICVAEEINLTPAGVTMGSIGQAIEAPFVLKKSGYKDIHRHPLFVFFATCNTGTVGTGDLNQALTSRFRTFYELAAPDEDTFIKVLMSWDSEFEEIECRNVYNYYMRVHNFLSNQDELAKDIALAISPRQCFGALEEIYEGAELIEAVKHCLIGPVGIFDTELYQRMCNSILSL